MNFASWTFVLLFLPATIMVFRLIPAHNSGSMRLAFLVTASALFYAWSGPLNALVLAASIAFNLGAGKLLTGPVGAKGSRRAVLWAAILVNVGLLAAFKIAALASPAPDGFRAAETILIPLALSFVTFQQIGFVVACYRRLIGSFGIDEYLFFILFFPQLIMGPIVRFQDIAAQLRAGQLKRSGSDDLAAGLSIFLFGLAQKVLLADQIAPAVDPIFDFAQGGPIATADAWFAIFAFQLQLYFDFAGYADMAIGLARMFGMRLPINFDRPLFATDRFDLWRRWHITFVMFMRNHVFFPLVRHWRWPVPAALALTGMLSGVWHGFGWTFVIWGLIQTAILLFVHQRRKWRRLPPERTLMRHMRAILLTFLTTALIGAMFRAPTLASAGHVYGALFGFGDAGLAPLMIGPRGLVLLPLCVLLAWGLPSSAQLFRLHWTAIDPRPGGKPPPRHPAESRGGFTLTPRWAVGMAALLVLCLVLIGEARRFVYVQF